MQTQMHYWKHWSYASSSTESLGMSPSDYGWNSYASWKCYIAYPWTETPRPLCGLPPRNLLSLLYLFKIIPLVKPLPPTPGREYPGKMIWNVAQFTCGTVIKRSALAVFQNSYAFGSIILTYMMKGLLVKCAYNLMHVPESTSLFICVLAGLRIQAPITHSECSR